MAPAPSIEPMLQYIAVLFVLSAGIYIYTRFFWDDTRNFVGSELPNMVEESEEGDLT